jgi:hypothetical protein
LALRGAAFRAAFFRGLEVLAGVAGAAGAALAASDGPAQEVSSMGAALSGITTTLIG